MRAFDSELLSRSVMHQAGEDKIRKGTSKCQIPIESQRPQSCNTLRSSIRIPCLDYLKYCSGEEENSFDYGSSDDMSVAVIISLGVQR
jgi:hypothetical protein